MPIQDVTPFVDAGTNTGFEHLTKRPEQLKEQVMRRQTGVLQNVAHGLW